MQSEIKSVCVLGQGYIGLPTSAILASRGLRVYGVDKNPDVVATISEGRVHIVEADLDGLVHKVVSSGNLTAHGEPQKADAFIIAVPTPLLEDNTPDVGYVEQAGMAIAPLLEKGNLVMIESTVPGDSILAV